MDKNSKKKNFIDKYKIQLHNYYDVLPIEILGQNNNNILDNTWVKSKSYDVNKINKPSIHEYNSLYNKQINMKIEKQIFNCKEITMKLNSSQKKILNNWFRSHTKMYNASLEYLKTEIKNINNGMRIKDLDKINEKNIINFFNLRKKLKNIKKEIQDNSITNNVLSNVNKTKIHIHTLDLAIKQLITNIKSSVSNIKTGNFKSFRIKYWKHNRPSKSMDIEKTAVSHNSIFYPILGNIEFIYNNKPYTLENVDCDLKINYNKITNTYKLLVPKKHVPGPTNKDLNDRIILDPGLRTFLTGLSNNNAIKIGTNVSEILIKNIKKKEKIENNSNLSIKRKRKIQRKINKKINNQVDELHWKSINYLTSNYKTILLGDMSAKSIVRKNGILNKYMKLSCLRTRFYDFRKRLEYKCKLKSIKYLLVDEYYTSKICSKCGNYNDKLKGEKIYDCSGCSIKIDRDINACRNILIKTLIK